MMRRTNRARGRTRLLAPVAIAASLLATPAMAQDRGIAVLLEQANYWKQQNRPDQVVRTLERVLQVDPRNTEALAGTAEAQALLGNSAQAQDALARLRQAAPADPRTVAADVAVRTTTVDAGQLAQARQLAQGGRNAEAVERYRALFRGGPVPDSFALEYYQTLAGTEGGWREARDGLSAMTRRSPNNTAAQLALAQVLTYREDTRAQGIEQLRRLSGQPEAQQGATAAWREALGWIGSGPEAVRPLEGFLQQFPNDADIQRRLQEARTPPPQAGADATGTLRVEAWRLFNANRLREAEERFEAVLAADPNDVDGLGGLGLIRLRQNRQADARRFLEAAIAADPSRRGAWERALQGATPRPAAAGGGGGGGAVPPPSPELQRARNLANAGNNSEAEVLLGRIVTRNGADRPDAEAMLGDIALQLGNAPLAEQRYRAALARRANFGAALSGLANALQAQGKFAEAEDVFRRIASNAPPQVRADALRAEAARTDDPAAAAALLTAAVQNEPNNPWPRLDLARLLARSGRAGDAKRLIDDSVASRATPDAIYAAAIFANEQGRFADAVRLLERIPAGARSTDQARQLASSRVQADVAAAALLARQGQRQQARQRLIGIASRPDATGEAAPAAVRALVALGDTSGAQAAARAATIAARGQSATAQIAAANALLEAGLDQDAAMAAQLIDPARLTAAQRNTAAALQSGISIRASDQLNRAGDQATAFEVLSPTLRQDPQSPAANLALARLYQGAREPEQAARIAEAVLSRNPRDTDARQAAMDAAIANRDWNRAEAILAEGRALMPTDARIPMLEARLARAWGDQRRAQQALTQAAQLRRQQIGLESQPVPQGSAGLAGPQAPQQQTGFENPFRRVPLSGTAGQAGALPFATQSLPNQAPLMQGQQFAQAMVPPQGPPPAQDPLLNEITRQLAEVREEAAPRGTPAFGLRQRSGTAGIDQLSEIHAGAEGAIAVPGIGGRLLARAALVNLDSGNLSPTLPVARQYGFNPLFLPGLNSPVTQQQMNQATNINNSASGVALGAAYVRNNFSIDIGSTPLGFDLQNVVGGIEIAPEIGDGVRLRLTAERRAMTDSMTSWAGSRDPVTQQLWGGVVRSGGRAQIEFSAGETNFYIAAGYFQFDGTGTADNSRMEAGAGFQVPLWRSGTEEIVSGLDIVYFAYDNNQRFFTLGNGGYFSPQSYISASVPLDWRGRSNNLFWRVGGTLGLTTFTEDDAPVFPNDTALQGQLTALAAASPGYTAVNPGQTKTGLTGGLRGDLEYAVSPQLRIGGALRWDQAAEWNEARALLYARYRFDR